MRVPGVGGPRKVLAAALGALEAEGLAIEAVAPIIDSAPIGPSRRRFANGVALLTARLGPVEMLALLQLVERRFGRRRRGQKWRARPLDLDIVVWDGGIWQSPALTIPHLGFRSRQFVLAPATAIAPHWRDPATGLTMAQLRARLDRPRRAP